MSRMQGNGSVSGSGPRVVMTSEEKFLRVKRELHEQLIAGMDLAVIGTMNEEELRMEVRRAAEELTRLSSDLLNLSERERLVNEVIDETFGLGPLEPLLRDPTITDIMVNGPKVVYVERRGRLEPVEIAFHDDRHLLQIIQRIVGRIGRRVDETSPMVDARLPDGSRVNAIIPPLALDGALLSIRRFGARPLLVADLMANKAITPEMVEFLSACVKARVNIIISGGTGSGKTTLMNALSAFIPRDERVATIEDAAELRLQQRHVVRMETRPPNIEGTGEVTTRDLVRNALRMRPDRIIVGECRGPEALDMLQAMNTGHEGSMTTIHANDTRDSLSRLEMMVGHGRVRPADLDHPPPDRLGHPHRHPGRPPPGRRPQGRQDLGDHRHGGGGHQHARPLRLQADRRGLAQDPPGVFLRLRDPAPVHGSAGDLGERAADHPVRAAHPRLVIARGGPT